MVADALSRKGWQVSEESIPYPSAQLCAISAAQPQWLQEVIRSYEHDQVCKDLIAYLALLESRIINIWGVKYKEKIYIGDSKGIRAHIMEALHASAFGGHSGQLGSTQRIGSIFYWPLMKQDIVKYVQHRYILEQLQDLKAELLLYTILLSMLAFLV